MSSSSPATAPLTIGSAPPPRPRPTEAVGLPPGGLPLPFPERPRSVPFHTARSSPLPRAPPFRKAAKVMFARSSWADRGQKIRPPWGSDLAADPLRDSECQLGRGVELAVLGKHKHLRGARAAVSSWIRRCGVFEVREKISQFHCQVSDSLTRSALRKDASYWLLILA